MKNNLRAFLKLLFPSKPIKAHENHKKQNDDSSPHASIKKETMTQLEEDMQEFNRKKSTNFVGFGHEEEVDFRNNFKKRYALEGLNFLLKRLKESPEAGTQEEAFNIIKEVLDELNKTYPLDWSINSGISKFNEDQVIVTLISHNLIVDNDGAFRIIDTKNGEQIILSKKSKY